MDVLGDDLGGLLLELLRRDGLLVLSQINRRFSTVVCQILEHTSDRWKRTHHVMHDVYRRSPTSLKCFAKWMKAPATFLQRARNSLSTLQITDVAPAQWKALQTKHDGDAWAYGTVPLLLNGDHACKHMLCTMLNENRYNQIYDIIIASYSQMRDFLINHAGPVDKFKLDRNYACGVVTELLLVTTKWADIVEVREEGKRCIIRELTATRHMISRLVPLNEITSPFL